ncbi:MAG: diacylglycerol kinase family protein [Ruminococcus sp.]|nr:diacylglycerol kinase family protein [Ruminococcus sp.]
MRKQLKSFKNAVDGFLHALKSEGHLRFHFIAAIYVTVFSFFFDLSCVKWAVVIMLITGIICAELFNTAIEKLCDKIETQYNEQIKFVKDVCAAAVLVLSIPAVIIAFLFYFDIEKITFISLYLLNNPLLLILFILSLIISVAFICTGFRGIARLFVKFKK